MVRTVVGLFASEAEAQLALERLLAAGFQRSNLNLATQETLRAQHLPAAPDSASVEPFEEGLVRFFTNLFAGNENDEEAQAYIGATRPGSAVLTVNAAAEEADRARSILRAQGAVDVYKQPVPQPAPASPADDIIDLEGDLSRVRDNDELDDNGLTTH